MHADFTDLRLMVRIAEANSLTRGAELVHLSLPAASLRIKALEEAIGAKLLYRTNQGVTLTQPGQAFVHHARLILNQYEHLSGDMQEFARGIKGQLRVYANTTALSEFLPPVLHDYLMSHPDVNIDLRERMSHVIVRAVTEGQTDIGIVGGPMSTEDLEVIPYRVDRMVLAVPSAHPLAKLESIGFIDTLELEHVSLHEASAIHAYLREICNRMHKHLKTRIQVSNFEAVARMVESDVGVGIMPETAARRHARTMKIACVPLLDEWAVRELLVCVRSLASLPAFARDLVDLLVADAKAAADGKAAA